MTKITHLKVSNSVSFSTFINLYNHHFFRVLKHFHHHQRSPHTHKAGAFPTSPFPIPGNVSMNLPILDISCKWNHIFCDLSLQSLSQVRLFATPRAAAHQAFLSITNSQILLKLMSIELVVPSYRLILCRPLLLLPSIFPSILFLRVVDVVAWMSIPSLVIVEYSVHCLHNQFVYPSVH